MMPLHCNHTLCLIPVGVCFKYGLWYSLLLVIKAHHRVELHMSAHSTKQRFSQDGYLVCTLDIHNKDSHPLAIRIKEICCFSLDLVYIFFKFFQKVWVLYHFVSVFCRDICTY